MKSFSKLLVLPLTIAAFLFTGPAAKASSFPLTIALDSPFQVGVSGQTLDFTGNITNTSGSSVSLGGDSFTLAGMFSVNDNGYYNNAPFSLDATQSSGDIDLFSVTIAPGTAAGLYVGVFDITNDNGAVVGTVDFDIDITPEPGTILLLGTGLLLLAGLIRLRMPKSNTLTTA